MEFLMDMLRAIAEIRNPVFDFFFSTITHLGEETLFLAVSIVFFWCVNKREGYYILVTGLLGTVINQFGKLLFRIPRPWVIDPEFRPIDSAIEEATGYSFPSGHTQNISTTFGSMASYNLKRKWIVAACVSVILLVGFSRMYLGVHTLLDVGVSLIIGFLLVLLLRPVFTSEERFHKYMPFVAIGGVVISLCYFFYVMSVSDDATLDPHNLASGIKNAYTLLGCTIAILPVYFIDRHLIRFETTAPWYSQLLKLVLGLGGVLLIKSGLSAPLTALFGNEYVARVVRYFLIVVFAGNVWPLTFRWFARLKCAPLDRFGAKVVGIFSK